MTTKSSQLQIRVTAAQKNALQQAARSANMDVSAYVLLRALPPAATRFQEILRELGPADDHRFTLATLNDFLEALTPGQFMDAVALAELEGFSPLRRNYVAAMVEQAAYRKGESPPSWARDVEPLDEPHFAVPFRRLRPHLLRASPVPFKRRNIFVDAAIGDRV